MFGAAGETQVDTSAFYRQEDTGFMAGQGAEMAIIPAWPEQADGEPGRMAILFSHPGSQLMIRLMASP
ncbi:hypothetical protein Geu3261_0037_125 [Komagataeibacter europaeus NBRC 3261]|uniref:Uncharacterized protein n=1 Tax=Komagataeibacter europaeus NBRC 3261 TaxID=1234669 RepID=A0A0D6PXH4_KOMEU|nr:hypothetical protein Geu3261_0037_125 [Komagataeibacter europaeus NBRC 3261]